jgi:hypothetical protein
MAPDPPRHPLVSAEFLKPGIPGQYRVLLTCGCGEVTDVTFEAFHVVGGQMAWTCIRCETPHWFPVEDAGVARWEPTEGGKDGLR